jgi:uncharacterized protein YgbK (DUF1537 family)
MPPPVIRSLLLVADDLTGASDAAVAFAQRGSAAAVLLSDEALHTSTATVCACVTATRDVPPSEAVTTLNALFQSLPPNRFETIFKKVDSVFRGNTFHEIAATIAAFPQHLAIVAPAAPLHGRTCIDGTLHIRDRSGTRTLDLREGFAAVGLNLQWTSADQFDPATRATIFCDALDDAHLDALVTAARHAQRPILWIGSSGLARALASSLYPELPHSPALPAASGQVLIFAGSEHPVTLAQLARLTPRHATVIPVRHNLTTPQEIRTAASACHPAAMLLLGGDTALLVCRALAIHTLCLRAEFSPGIPIAIARGGPFDGATLLLKSGGFGSPTAIRDIVSHFGTPAQGASQ